VLLASKPQPSGPQAAQAREHEGCGLSLRRHSAFEGATKIVAGQQSHRVGLQSRHAVS
jgi:hypothetical protein